MAQLQAQLKRGILDELWFQARSTAITLEEAIRAFKSCRFQDIQRGTFVASTSGGGHSVSFHIPEIFRQLGPDQFFMLGQEFLEIRSDAITIQTSSTPPGPTDDNTIYTVMTQDDRMVTVREMMVDTTSVRFPTYGPAR